MAGNGLFPENGDEVGLFTATPQLDYPTGTPWVDEVQVSVELPMGPAGPQGDPPVLAIHDVLLSTPETPPDVRIHQGENPLDPPGDGVWYLDFVLPQGPPGTDGTDGEPGPPLNVVGELPPGTLPPTPPPAGTMPGDAWFIGYDLWIWTESGWVLAEDYRGPAGPAGRAYVGTSAPTATPVEGDLWFNPVAAAYAPLGMRVDGALQLSAQGGEIRGDAGNLSFLVGHAAALEQARLTSAGFITMTAFYVAATKALSMGEGKLRLGSPGAVTVADGSLWVSTPVDDADAVPKKHFDDGQASMKGYVDTRIWYGTQAEYDAIAVKDPTVLYCVGV